MKRIVLLIALILVSYATLTCETNDYFRIDSYFKQDLKNEEVGGLFVNTILADSTSEYWTYRVYQDGEDYFDRSCRSIKGVEKLPSGFYDIVIPFNHLAYPDVKNVEIVQGYVTVVDIVIAGRIVLHTNKPAITFHLYNMETGEETGKNEKIIYAGEMLNYDVLPGRYKIIATSVFEDPADKPKPLENKPEFIIDIKPWKITKIAL